MNYLPLLWLGDIFLASFVIYLTIQYLNLVAPKGRRMAYKYANPLVAVMTKLDSYYAPLALLLVGLLANAVAYTGNCLTSLTVVVCGIVALRATGKAYRTLVG